jgi:hypothetical protein
MNSTPQPSLGHRYCGRDFTAEEIDRIRELIAAQPPLNRAQLSRRVCDELRWLRPDGARKDMSCRVAMLRMERDGLIRLPPPLYKNGNGRIRPKRTAAGEPRKPIQLPRAALGEIALQPVRSRQDSALWNELIERYHYLGYKPLPGAQLRYLVRAHGDRWPEPPLLAALGFGAAAWMVAPRDRFIGWTAAERKRNLHLVVNNARFLILPWVQVRNLASTILAHAARRIANDWKDRYGFEPVLLETFVDTERFHGTCYRAANWVHVGQTQGRGKLNKKHIRLEPIKDIYLQPLTKRFRHTLQSP